MKQQISQAPAWVAGFLLMVLGGNAAADEGGGLSLGVAAGTLGLGAELGYAVNRNLGIRVGVYGLTWDVDGKEGGIDYDADLDLSSAGAYVDWHPFGGAFRITGGWFVNDNGIDATGRPGAGDTYDIGGTTFTSDEVGRLTASVDFGSSAPYLGLGWNFGGQDGGLGISLDLGVLFQDSPDITLVSRGGTLSGQPALQQALRDEERELEDDVDEYELYPVVSLGVSYRF
jgi:hypothetical protein